jgi:hypothetical protein
LVFSGFEDGAGVAADPDDPEDPDESDPLLLKFATS